ncbi:GNAT family N-acetyltransferase [Massilia sp. IC2-476]|uniref:GNAT family N-acetyltransferase n=1 Tax=Massilia sp. IC2-476 TaxID=2887199 RepID=UPI001D11F41E|nr:GNAT family N-acetyltransferase [Massilia sp. IC2-476]MCC2973790.1 GNAT family N-acetyltransferase [Massilia sp. IC2-476]
MMDMNEAGEGVDGGIRCYRDTVPPFVEEALADLYDTLHASLPFFRVYRSLDAVSCYIAERDGRPSTILLFRCEGRRIEVLNEMIAIDQPELRRFARYVFHSYPEVDLIGFKALKTTTPGLGYPVQQHNAKDTYVIALPDTPNAYLASLGKSTRANIRQQTNLVNRSFPSFCTRFYTGHEIEEAHVRAILGFSEEKIKAGGATIAHDLERIMALARACGYVVVLFIDGQVCAGSVNYWVGSSVFGDVTGYDRRYEKFSLGKLCVFQTICESIARGAKRFYLGGGEFDFKGRLNGVALEMDEVRIYRSRWRMLVNLDRAAEAVLKARVRQLKKRLHRHKQHLLARMAFRLFYLLKGRAAH